jgi:hypothetical protein
MRIALTDHVMLLMADATLVAMTDFGDSIAKIHALINVRTSGAMEIMAHVQMLAWMDFMDRSAKIKRKVCTVNINFGEPVKNNNK